MFSMQISIRKYRFVHFSCDFTDVFITTFIKNVYSEIEGPNLYVSMFTFKWEICKKKNEVGFVCVTLFSCEFFQDSQEYGVSPVSTCTSFIKFKEFEI